MTHRSKAFDCVRYDLLIAKLITYGFHQEVLKLIRSYLFDKSQKVRVSFSFSYESYILHGVSQGLNTWSTTI